MNGKKAAMAAIICLILIGGAWAGASWSLSTVLAAISGGTVEPAKIQNDLHCEINLGNMRPGQETESTCQINNISTNIAGTVFGEIYINDSQIGTGIDQIFVSGQKQNPQNPLISEAFPEILLYNAKAGHGQGISIPVREINRSDIKIVIKTIAAVNTEGPGEIGKFTVNLRVTPVMPGSTSGGGGSGLTPIPPTK